MTMPPGRRRRIRGQQHHRKDLGSRDGVVERVPVGKRPRGEATAHRLQQTAEGLGPSQRRLEHGTHQVLDVVHQKSQHPRRAQRLAHLCFHDSIIGFSPEKAPESLENAFPARKVYGKYNSPGVESSGAVGFFKLVGNICETIEATISFSDETVGKQWQVLQGEDAFYLCCAAIATSGTAVSLDWCGMALRRQPDITVTKIQCTKE